MSRWWACAVAGLLAGSAPSIAGAQTFELFGPDSSRSRHESTQNFLVELRGGPWYPNVDSEFDGHDNDDEQEGKRVPNGFDRGEGGTVEYYSTEGAAAAGYRREWSPRLVISE